ncbi:Hypothetical protein AJAP_12115 [Amycolatopsis japonica]|uniref:Uncharacterized protein n=2 Tax=Pseudonocardiaceae TaxID=2070 RepID=A0A075UYQ1_9PSEU|nr:Hypothetical protein AJAP_12115 [Amycolatopsis japonica]
MKFLRRLVILAVALTLVSSPPAFAIGTPKLLIGQDFPDPDIVKTDSGFFAFSASTGAVKVPYAHAPAAEGPWRVAGDALAAVPKWAKPDGGFWAPDVARLSDGTFVLYFSAAVAPGGEMCIGVATAAKAEGPYTPAGDGPLICVPGDGGDIDPQTFVDSDGSRYLLYKSDGAAVGPPAAIWSQKLRADGRTPDGPRIELLRADLASENAVVEAPAVVKTPSRYLLFYSADTFQSSGYHTGIRLRALVERAVREGGHAVPVHRSARRQGRRAGRRRRRRRPHPLPRLARRRPHRPRDVPAAHRLPGRCTPARLTGFRRRRSGIRWGRPTEGVPAMTAQPPDPEPEKTRREPGGGVRPGDTPPDSAQTSGLSHPQPMPSKAMPVAWLILIGVIVVLASGFVVALALGWLKLG